MPRFAMVTAIAAIALLGLARPGLAYDEADAPRLRPDVAAAWHSPSTIAPHTQWQGFLRLREGHQVVTATYQVCQVGKQCFAPPHAAERLDNLTFRFETVNYLANGAPVDFQAGWRIGVKWVLTDLQNRSAALPAGLAESDPLCQSAALACAESHYLAFDMPPATKETPGTGPLLVLVALLGTAWGRRQG